MTQSLMHTQTFYTAVILMISETAKTPGTIEKIIGTINKRLSLESEVILLSNKTF